MKGETQRERLIQICIQEYNIKGYNKKGFVKGFALIQLEILGSNVNFVPNSRAIQVLLQPLI